MTFDDKHCNPSPVAVPKKGWGVNEKVVEARDRKQQAKSEARHKEAKAKEDAYWEQHANPKTRKDAKREEEERKREEAAARKAEIKRLAEAEAAELAKAAQKKAPAKLTGVAHGKVTAHQLHLSKEEEKKLEERLAKERADAARRMVSEESYAQQIEVENVNRQEGVMEARSVEAALEALSVVGGEAAADRHPEKRAKAAWEAFYESELPLLKQQKPGLRLMQYKSMLFDQWQRHPQNPRNQKQQQ